MTPWRKARISDVVRDGGQPLAAGGAGGMDEFPQRPGDLHRPVRTGVGLRGVSKIAQQVRTAARPFSGVADHGRVEALWLAALEGRWPLLPRAIALVRGGFFAVEGGLAVGCVAVDLAGSIPWCSSRPGTSGAGSALACSAPHSPGCAPPA